MKTLALFAIASAAIVGVSAFLYAQGKPGKRSPGTAGPGAAAGMQLKFPVTREDIVGTIEIKGKSSYVKETWISAPFEANVKKWRIGDGSQVSKGDVLFELDGAELGADIAQLEAGKRKRELEASLARFQASAGGEADGAVSEAGAKQRYAAQQSRELQTELSEVSGVAADMQLEAKRAKLAQANYAAPDSGIFLFSDTKEPQRVKEGDKLGKIVDLTKLQLVTTVGEYDVFRIRPGMPVDVKVDALQGVKLKGAIERVSKFAKPGTDGAASGAAQFEVVIALEPNEKLIAGLSLTGTIETERKQGVLAVPTFAVQHDKDQAYVMVLGSSGAAEKRPITAGVETADKTEVAGGLNEGDTVVLE
ncbi:RND transporter [Gordoniibacillus kamchatkensis]|uniref:RND transporter n=2 Tax=Gordoniibacillus kamchatkensis TaxID=1590651 RepID=A0ABR5AC29_9BACL|nr:RND transporter [Paenibacillus sp. VKM B-2647]